MTAEARPTGTMMELGAPNIAPHTHTQRCDGVGVGDNTGESSNPSLFTYATQVSGHMSG